ncbi:MULTISPECIES: hypothetical protein [Actinomadura]|uniref:Coenzyme PQQ synthesis protein A n=1 Tax=Actinomadura miaoliensis TaxID=430685 RepID=A0ABP7W487_9ACTN
MPTRVSTDKRTDERPARTATTWSKPKIDISGTSFEVRTYCYAR